MSSRRLKKDQLSELKEVADEIPNPIPYIAERMMTGQYLLLTGIYKGDPRRIIKGDHYRVKYVHWKIMNHHKNIKQLYAKGSTQESKKKLVKEYVSKQMKALNTIKD